MLLLAAVLLSACGGRPVQKTAEQAPLPSTAAASPPAPAAAASDATPYSPDPNVQLVQLVDPLQTQTVDLTAQSNDVWQRIRRGFSMPTVNSPLVEKWIAYYTERPDYVQRMTERASLYLYYIVEEVQRRGMPTELALLPFVESAYNPMAYSRSRAAGMWQFIPSTGRLYQLKQDGWRDERRDVIASTNAALDYLQKIYEQHGDWQLALASYNWGEGAVGRAVERNRAKGLPTDYLSLQNMPPETRNYLPKLQAVKNIISDPATFNLTLPPVGNEVYFTAIQKKRDIDLETAAQLAEMSLEDFQALNPSFTRPIILGAQNASILLPKDKVAIFQNNLAQHTGPLSRWDTYTFRRGDRLDRVAGRHGMTLAQIKTVNNIGKRERITPGMVLLVPRANKEAVVKQAPAASANDTKVVTKNFVHIVKTGDTLYSISRSYDVDVNDIRDWNKLHNTLLSVGQRLIIKHDEVALK
ncbi:MAG: LysM peptidoglycan-binding domain-containing protein [Burkholderiaceae bacterium]|nr:MAG: LysM peptidoglycan-binding domain-containing protein [Burkholderiaceae bacterium]